MSVNTMGYDYSVTKRKGCNYCVRGKKLYNKVELTVEINDDDCNGNAELLIRLNTESYVAYELVKICYCPICGKELV